MYRYLYTHTHTLFPLAHVLGSLQDHRIPVSLITLSGCKCKDSDGSER